MSIFKARPRKILQKRYEKIMQEALAAQRNGNIQGYADLHQNGESILRQLEELNACKTGE